MSGSSMLEAMGPLRAALEEDGYDIVSPNGGHRMSEADLDDFIEWMTPVYSKQSPAARKRLRGGEFFRGHEHYDWLRPDADPFGPKKRYEALDDSLTIVERHVSGHDVEGVVAFSQGAVLATLLAYLGAKGDARFPPPRWAIYVAGFPPNVSSPLTVTYPFEAPFARLFVVGDHDPVFTTGAAHLKSWAQCFRGGSDEFYVGPCGHDIPRDEASVERMVAFVRSSQADEPST